MGLFKKKKATELINVDVSHISLVTENYRPVNGKKAIIKAEGEKVIFKAAKVIEGIAEGQFMIADELDKQDEFYSFDTVQETAIAVLKAVKEGKTDLFNKNHQEGAIDGISISKMSIDYVEKSWNGSIDFSKNNEIMEIAKSDQFEGFSIEGLAGKIEKASSDSKIVESLEELITLVKATLADNSLSDVIKKGNIEVNAAQSFDLVNKQIDSIFKTDVNNNINKSTENITEDSEMDEKQVLNLIVKALDERDKKNESLAKAEASKAEMTAVKVELEDLKKAVADNKQKAGESADTTQAEVVKGFSI